ncbi:MAG: hypothetical protein RIB03_05040 [Henriciella sp.]|uniref:hypothetical protein n=1 Tax=Henriciella sp. TaxID=1968823 RepID=UPI0032F05A8E
MRILTFLAASAILAACGGADDTPSDIAAPAPPATETGQTPPSSAASGGDRAASATLDLPVGTHCYFRDDASTTEGLEVTVSEAGDFSGSNYGLIHQEEEAYYASFDITLTNGRTGESGLVTFDSVTEVDGDTQTGTMTWEITSQGAAPDGFLEEPMQPADCDGLADRVFPDPGGE